jgi:glycosyltransferase involved in cell wall biosynthesis
VGEGALLVDPYDEEAIAQGIARLLDDEDLRQRLVARGLVRAATFSWERSVRQIHAGYLKALGRPAPAALEATS